MYSNKDLYNLLWKACNPKITSFKLWFPSIYKREPPYVSCWTVCPVCCRHLDLSSCTERRCNWSAIACVCTCVSTFNFQTAFSSLLHLLNLRITDNGRPWDTYIIVQRDEWEVVVVGEWHASLGLSQRGTLRAVFNLYPACEFLEIDIL